MICQDKHRNPTQNWKNSVIHGIKFEGVIHGINFKAEWYHAEDDERKIITTTTIIIIITV